MWTVNKFSLTSFCCSCPRNIVKTVMHLSQVKTAICLPKPKVLLEHGRIHTNKFPLSKSWHDYSFATRLLRKEILSKIRKIVYHTHEQINIVLTKDKEGLLVKVNCSSVHGFKLIKLHVVAI